MVYIPSHRRFALLLARQPVPAALYTSMGLLLLLCLLLPTDSLAEQERAFMDRMQSMGAAMPDKASRPAGLAVTVLGSGGPMAMTDRASAGYVVYRDRVPRILVDGGGGTFERLGEGRIFDLVRMDTWLFTHLHIDHSAEFPAIVKSMYFLRRGYNKRSALTVIGPDAWGDFPSTSEFVDAYFNKDHGIYRYLHHFMQTIKAGELSFETKDLAYDYERVKTPEKILSRDGMSVSYIPVMHGPRQSKTPAVAYRVDYGGQSITFSGDLNSKSGNLVKLAKGSDMLIYDAALGPAQDFDPPEVFHTPPADIGKAATAAGVKTLVLSHFMPPYVPMKIDRILAAVKAEFSGEVILAKDLMTLSAQGNGASSSGDSPQEPQRKGPMQRFRERMQSP